MAINNPIVTELFHFLKKKGVSVPQFSLETGIPKDRVYKWKQQGTSPKSEDEKIIRKWIELDIYPIGKSLVEEQAPELSKPVRQLIRELEVKVDVLTDTMASVLSATSGENLTVVKGRMEKAFSDVLKLRYSGE